MSITLDGTNGITTPDVDSTTSVTTPLVTNAGTLALSATGANIVTASTNGVERLRITSAGSVGIGTSSPASALEIRGVSIGEYFRAGGGTISDRSLQFSNFNIIGLSGVGHRLSVPNANGALAFDIGGSERARIDSVGNLFVGKTSVGIANKGVQLLPSGQSAFTADSGQVGLFINHVSPSGTQTGVEFRYGSTTTVGTITLTASATAYNTSSDYRLKEDVQPMVGSVDRLMALKPVNFAWKVDGSRVDGFLAHEAQEVVPECVTGEKDAVDDEGNPQYQGIDQSKIVPLLVAALQEALTKIEALEARVAALETNA